MKPVVPALLFILLAMAGPAFSHGVQFQVSRESAVVLKARYDDGTPMGYAKVTIFSPESRETEFQNGRSDRDGAFAFVPPHQGAWEVTFDDETGHGFKEKIDVEAPGTTGVPQGGRHFPREYKLITGLSLIWGLTGTLLYFKARQRPAPGIPGA